LSLLSIIRLGTPITDSKTFCTALLQNRKLALVPGAAFMSPPTIRISYAASQQELEKAMDALEDFVLRDI